MNYLLFNDDIYITDGSQVKRIENALGQRQVFESIDAASICVVDVDVELASAPETPIEKKDSMLARKFSKLHPQHEYVLQDEKISDNIFQVVGIKAERIREIYSLIPSDRVRVLIPYGMALRFLLVKKGVNLAKGLVFIDDLGEEKLITVFLGGKFSVTRSLISDDIDSIIPEIKRSQIGFSRKIEDFDSWKPDKPFVLTNCQDIMGHSALDELDIEYINVRFPSIEGLAGINVLENNVKFLLPEEIKDKKKKEYFRQKAISVLMVLLILGTGLVFVLFNKIKFSILTREYNRLILLHKALEDQLTELDKKTYREDLNGLKTLNYSIPYFKILNILPLSYEIQSFRFSLADRWNLQTFVYSKDKELLEEIPRVSILKNALISDYFIKDKPGKRIQVDL